MNAVYRDRLAGRGLGEEHRILIAPDELGQVVRAVRRLGRSGPKARTQRTEDEDAAAKGSSGEERGESSARSARTSRNLVILAKGSASVYAKTEKTHMRGLGSLTWEDSEDSQADVYYRNAHGDRREADGERRANFEGYVRGREGQERPAL